MSKVAIVNPLQIVDRTTPASTNAQQSVVANTIAQSPAVPVLAYVVGAIVVGGGFVAVVAMSMEYQWEKLFPSIRESISFITVVLCLSYVGAAVAGFAAMLLQPNKPANYWQEHLPLSAVHYVAGFACCALFVIGVTHLDNVLAVPNLTAQLTAEFKSGRFAFWLAMMLCCCRTAWLALLFSLRRKMGPQYAIFMLGFMSLLVHYQLLPSTDDVTPLTVYPAVTSWALLLVFRVWSIAEHRSANQQTGVKLSTLLTVAAGNTIIVANLAVAVALNDQVTGWIVTSYILRGVVLAALAAFLIGSFFSLAAMRVDQKPGVNG